MYGEDTIDEVGGASSRSQKGGGCQLHCTPDTKSTIPHWEGHLGPGRVINIEVDVGDGAHNGPELHII